MFGKVDIPQEAFVAALKVDFQAAIQVIGPASRSMLNSTRISFRFDIRRLNHSLPLGDLIGNKLIEIPR
jgi:hypothetical protein